MHCGH